MLDTTKLSDQAFALGKEDGKARGSWVIDGNTSEDTANHILKGYEDGDPEVMDLEPNPLSGEWAGDPTPDTLANALALVGLGEEHRGTELDQLCTDYELGFSEGFWEEVTRSAKAMLAC